LDENHVLAVRSLLLTAKKPAIVSGLRHKTWWTRKVLTPPARVFTQISGGADEKRRHQPSHAEMFRFMNPVLGGILKGGISVQRLVDPKLKVFGVKFWLSLLLSLFGHRKEKGKTCVSDISGFS